LRTKPVIQSHRLSVFRIHVAEKQICPAAF